MTTNQSALDYLGVIAGKIDDAKATLDAFEVERAKAIRRGHDSGVPAVDLAAAAGLSRARAYQILADR